MYSNDLLQDFENPAPVKSRLYQPLLFLFLAFLATQTAAFFEHREGYGETWEAVVFAFGIPVLGLILFLFKKKAGWFICTFYLLFSFTATIVATIGQIMDETIRFIPLASLMLILECAASVLLLSPSIRQQFRVSAGLLFTTLFIIAALSFFVVYYTFFK